MNPWQMGVMAIVTTKLGNFTRLLMPGTSDLTGNFDPPALLRNAFVEAYKIAIKRGRWLALNATGELVEFTADAITTPTPVAPDSAAEIEWREWLTATEPKWERVHAELSEWGVWDLAHQYRIENQHLIDVLYCNKKGEVSDQNGLMPPDKEVSTQKETVI